MSATKQTSLLAWVVDELTKQHQAMMTNDPELTALLGRQEIMDFVDQAITDYQGA